MLHARLGAANVLMGVHAWNAAVLEGKGYAAKGVGIAVNANQNRLIG
jgi:hypothetical protein